MTVIATGGNYTLTMLKGVLGIVIRPRPDLSYEEGAALAEELDARVRQLATTNAVTGLLMDLRAAPYVWGPVTDTALKRVFGHVASTGRPVSALSTDTMQRYMVENILRDVAPQLSRLFESEAEARGWLLRWRETSKIPT